MSSKYLNKILVVQNVLTEKTALKINLPLLTGKNHLNSEQFEGGITLVNFGGSLCQPCREEHPISVTITKDKHLNIVGTIIKITERILNAF
ncbi:hypothetical protein [Bartonella sp. B41]